MNTVGLIGEKIEAPDWFVHQGNVLVLYADGFVTKKITGLHVRSCDLRECLPVLAAILVAIWRHITQVWLN